MLYKKSTKVANKCCCICFSDEKDHLEITLQSPGAHGGTEEHKILYSLTSFISSTERPNQGQFGLDFDHFGLTYTFLDGLE